MRTRTRFALNLFLWWVGVSCGPCVFGNVPNSSQTVNVFLGSFGPTGNAIYLREKLIQRLQKSHQIAVVSNPHRADLLVVSSAVMRSVGYYYSNPRLRYRTSPSVPVYDAWMELELNDSRGWALWWGKFKPRFWGSQYVSDNLVNQAGQQVVRVTSRQKRTDRQAKGQARFNGNRL